MAKFVFLAKNLLVIWWLLVVFTGLAACGGTLEVNLSLEPSQPQPQLGRLAFITGGDLWVLDLDNQQSTRLTRDGYNSSPDWSASSRYLAYLKRGQLWTIEISSKKAMRIDETPVEWFDWAPQGDLLAFYSRRSGLVIWNPNFQTAVSLLPTIPGSTQEIFSWSADGSALFFNKGSIINGKYQVSLESVQINQESSLMLFASNDLGAVPRLALPSPDNRWLAYWSWDTITPFAEEQGLQVCLLELQTNQPGCTDLKTNPAPESIAWSANGDIALVGQDQLGVSTSLVVVDASTRSIKNLLSFNDHSPLYPAWSPDGEFIAISARPPDRPGQNGNPTPVASITGRRLWIVNRDSGELRQLTRDSLFNDERPIWSPDGKQLMFARLAEESASLWMVKTDGSGLRQVISELTPLPEPAGQFAVVSWSTLWDWWRPENR